MTNKERICQLANAAYLGRAEWQPHYLKHYLSNGDFGDAHGVEADIRHQRATAQSPEARELFELLGLAFRLPFTQENEYGNS